MSLFSNIKFFIKKYINNPILVVAASYMLYKYITRHKKKESMVESVKVIDDEANTNHSILFDEVTGKYILIYNYHVYSSDNKEELELFLKQLEVRK
jgi:predicted small secreted protein